MRGRRLGNDRMRGVGKMIWGMVEGDTHGQYTRENYSEVHSKKRRHKWIWGMEMLDTFAKSHYHALTYHHCGPHNLLSASQYCRYRSCQNAKCVSRSLSKISKTIITITHLLTDQLML